MTYDSPHLSEAHTQQLAQQLQTYAVAYLRRQLEYGVDEARRLDCEAEAKRQRHNAVLGRDHPIVSGGGLETRRTGFLFQLFI